MKLCLLTSDGVRHAYVADALTQVDANDVDGFATLKARRRYLTEAAA